MAELADELEEKAKKDSENEEESNGNDADNSKPFD